jgi:hypothetical protein
MCIKVNLINIYNNNKNLSVFLFNLLTAYSEQNDVYQLLMKTFSLSRLPAKYRRRYETLDGHLPAETATNLGPHDELKDFLQGCANYLIRQVLIVKSAVKSVVLLARFFF